MGGIILYGIITTVLLLVSGCSSQSQTGTRIPKIQKSPLNSILSTSQQNVNNACLPEVSCDTYEKYRTFDGSCNNLKNPAWGVANTPVVRLFPAFYDDGESLQRLSEDGNPLPNARYVRTTLLPDGENAGVKLTLAVMSWGQMVAHDVALRATSPEGPKTCCNADGSFNPDPVCHPIAIPIDDNFYSKFNQLCMHVKRVRPTNDLGCLINPVQQISGVTHYMDGSFIYGSSKEAADSLRQFEGGLLKCRTTDDGRPFLINVQKPTEVCDVPRDTDVCYMAGDPDRVNTNTEIAVTQVMFLRLHNKLATDLHHMHPSWSDEMLFQETRRIVIAIVQHITYNEYLPLLLGSTFVKNHQLAPQKSGYSKYGYDASINPSTLSEFVSAAFRSLHSAIVGSPKLVSEYRLSRGSIQLSDYTNRPGIIEAANNFDNFLRGLISQPQSDKNYHFTEQITNSFLGNKENPIAERNGTDMISIDIHRGREYGVPPYTTMRILCGLPPVNDFEDLRDFMDADKVSLLSEVYSSVHDIDYYVGGMLEKKIPRTLVSPSFHCVIAEAFHRYKFGDRFFYEFDGHPGTFTLDQLDSIRKFTYSALVCMTSDHIQVAQPMGFHKINSKLNPLRPCSEITKAFKLDPWAKND
ncbi:peroxidase-like [Planococcus citri]|uniref:peroxidase-like n=1 Tax=Planococcus citri TaxID=170843 RepID=UPI0031F82A35